MNKKNICIFRFILILFLIMTVNNIAKAQDAIVTYKGYLLLQDGYNKPRETKVKAEFYKNKIKIYHDGKLFFDLNLSGRSTGTAGNEQYIMYQGYDLVDSEKWQVEMYESAKLVISYSPMLIFIYEKDKTYKD